MSKFTYVVTDEVGIHARPAQLLVKKCTEYKSAITLTCNGKSADAKRIMGVMALGAKKGTTVEISIDGEDEAKAKAELEAYFKANF
ncbi:MAG: HPr family phosphocarrier protein [Lachnospiraceae bacterium]|nr:HPr family phosphocarrier protein [Lachnospiraceae bacterium]